MFRTGLLRGACAVALVLSFADSSVFAQQSLPTIDIGGVRSRVAGRGGGRAPSTATPPAAPATPTQTGGGGGSLTVPSVAEQRRELMRNVGSVAFVDANTPEIQTRYVHDLRDALKDVPGVYVESRYGQELRLSIRGSNLTRDFHLRGLELLQDGIPMNYADGGGDMYQIDPKYFRAIEVLKGGNALAYGSSTLGGAINFISPTAYTALAPNMASLEGGSYGTVRGQAQMSRIIGNFDFLINGTFTHADNYRKHSTTDYTQLNGNLGYRFSNDLETRFYFGVYDTWQLLPGQLNEFDARNDPRLSLPPFPPGFGADGFGANQARNVKNWRISNKTTILSEIGRIDLNSWYTHNYLYHPIFVVIEQEGGTWGFTPRLTSNFLVDGHPNELILGGRVWGGSSSDNWFDNYNGMRLNPYGGIPANFASAQFSFPPYSFNGLAQFGAANSCFGFCGLFINPGLDPRLRNNRATALNLEAYFENRLHIAPQLIFMFGAKLFADTRRYAVLGGIPFEPVPGVSDKVYRGIVPKVGLMFEPTPDIQFFADMTGSRDVPDFIDLTQGVFPPPRDGTTFTPLAAQKAWTGELGARGGWDRYTWDVTFYHSELQDELLKFTTNPGLGIPATTFNAKRTMHQGVEFAASAELLRDIFAPDAGDALKLSQVWTWNDFRFVGDRDFGDNTLAGIPRHVLRTTLSYWRPADGLYFAPQMDWVPAGAYVDYANTLQAPGYVLLGVQAGMKLPYGLSFFVEARNLTNRHYISDVTTIVDARGLDPRVFYPGTGRVIYGGLRLAF
ncbi:TonB-dependent receptor domain-containing protein [Methylocystis sp. SC2]|uniref:TonB-dependent receptor family protein n=1 Tax=Methylocystis sp. (strain SC2) TaxID=187303 RepID=UPI00027AE927|nr:TonB-dependent receptor [Methylocystis sp. SC2]CCJ06757.1 TonB-dependent receptor [Methylocystis sp. SC2]